MSKVPRTRHEVKDRETAIKLSIKKWEKIEIMIFELASAHDVACGFCDLAIFKKYEADPEERKGKGKCKFCDQDAFNVCHEMLENFGDHIEGLNKSVKAVLGFLRGRSIEDV